MKVSRLWSPVTRWGDFRRRQLAALEESNRIAARVRDDDAETSAPTSRPSADATRRTPGPPSDEAAPPVGGAPRRRREPLRPAGPGRSTAYGVVGRPLNRHSPFYIGFFGATGALLAIGLWHLVGRLTTTLTLLIVSMFLALALNPHRRRPRAPAGMRRSRCGRRSSSPASSSSSCSSAPSSSPRWSCRAPSWPSRRPATSRTSSAARGCARSTRATTSSTRSRRRSQARMTDQQFLEGRARRHPRRGARGAQRRLPGLHRARADPVLPLLAPARQARRLRAGAGRPGASGSSRCPRRSCGASGPTRSARSPSPPSTPCCPRS